MATSISRGDHDRSRRPRRSREIALRQDLDMDRALHPSPERGGGTAKGWVGRRAKKSASRVDARLRTFHRRKRSPADRRGRPIDVGNYAPFFGLAGVFFLAGAVRALAAAFILAGSVIAILATGG